MPSCNACSYSARASSRCARRSSACPLTRTSSNADVAELPAAGMVRRIGCVGLTFIAIDPEPGLERRSIYRKREAFVPVDERLAFRDGARLTRAGRFRSHFRVERGPPAHADHVA